jgi:SSS family transporter
LENTLYVLGGSRSPDAAHVLRKFWALPLSKPDAGWQELEAWPGSPRMSPVLVAVQGAVYLFGGIELLAEDGEVKRHYLQDAWRYVAKEGWRQLPDAPRPIAAAPAVPYGQSHIVVLGGIAGESVSREVLSFHTLTRTWTPMGTLPQPVAGATAVDWLGQIVVPGGATRPEQRSAKVLTASPAESRHGFGVLDYVVLSMYLSGIVMMGVLLTRRNRNTGDFFLGGKRVPWWAAGLSIYGTQLSSITFMAIPAKAYATDWTFALVNACILLVAPVIVYFYMPFFHRLNITTAYEYLEKRFNRSVRMLSSTLFLVFQLGRLAVVMFLPAIALAAVSDTNVYACIIAMGGLAVIYTVLGGMQAVIWTDVVQSIVLLGGALLSLYLAVAAAGSGPAEVFTSANSEGKFQMFDWRWDWTIATVWVIVLGNCASVLATYTTDQTVVQKYLTTTDERRSAKSIWTNAVLTIPSTIIFFSMGTALFGYYKTHPAQLNPHLPTDAILPWFMVQALPAGVAGLVLAGLFAAAQSTLSSSMHSMATVLMVDFYRPFRAASSENHQLRLARIFTALLGLLGTGLALVLATYDIRSLWDLFLTLLSLVGGSLAGIFALGIFTCRAHGPGTIVGAVVSTAVVVLVWRFTNLHFFLYAPIGLISCLVSGYVASLVIPAQQRQLDGLTVYANSTVAASSR